MLFAISAIIGLAWTFRVAWNARHLGAKGFDVSPAASVWWYFVPFANLVMPYRAMRQIYAASKDPPGWKDDPQPIVLAWWLLVIASGIFARLASAVDSASATTIGGVDVIATVLQAGACAAFSGMVWRLSRRQWALSARSHDAPATGGIVQTS